jgi:hypothetical protein
MNVPFFGCRMICIPHKKSWTGMPPTGLTKDQNGLILARQISHQDRIGRPPKMPKRLHDLQQVESCCRILIWPPLAPPMFPSLSDTWPNALAETQSDVWMKVAFHALNNLNGHKYLCPFGDVSFTTNLDWLASSSDSSHHSSVEVSSTENQERQHKLDSKFHLLLGKILVLLLRN